MSLWKALGFTTKEAASNLVRDDDTPRVLLQPWRDTEGGRQYRIVYTGSNLQVQGLYFADLSEKIEWRTVWNTEDILMRALIDAVAKEIGPR